MNKTGVAVAIILAAVAFMGNYLWSRQARQERIERLVSRVKTPNILKEHSKVFNKPEVIKVTDNIWVAIGFALANSIMIEGDDGVIIVDVTESYEAASEVFKMFREITKKPVKGIIYTHNHADHTFGAKAFMEEDPTHPPEIWAHHRILREFQSFFYTSPILTQRSMRQFGALNPDIINAGIGFRLRMGSENSQPGLVYPNKLFIGQERDVSIAGINMKLVHIPGETSDQIGVWIPSQKAFLCADDLYRAFPNLYAIRGTPSRSLLDWASSLDTIINFEPVLIVPSHTRPISGVRAIKDLLTAYRDAIQFVHDQTIRYMNKGLMPDEIAAMVKLPDHLANNPYLLEFYGTVEWSVKGVFNTYLGWFSGDPVDLSPLTPDETASRVVTLGGGIEKVVEQAQDALEKEDYRWALVLSSHVLHVDPSNKKAIDVKAPALMALGNQQISANGRNYFYTSALELLGEVDTRPKEGTKAGIIKRLPLLNLFKVLQVRFNAEECMDKNITIAFQFRNPKSFMTMQIRNAVVRISDHPAEEWDIKVTTSEEAWRDSLVSRLSAVTSYASGDFQIEGGALNFRNIMGCFDSD